MIGIRPWVLAVVIGGVVMCMSWVIDPLRRVMQYMNMDNEIEARASEEEVIFPQVSGFNLSGEEFNFPADFAAPYNIVLLAYTQNQQYDVYTWLPLLQELEAELPEVHYYEFPTLPAYNPIFRAQIDSWMIAGIPDPDTRARTITLYLDVAKFNRALNIEDSREMRVLLVTPEGRVLWQGTGDFSEAKGESLQSVLDQLLNERSS